MAWDTLGWPSSGQALVEIKRYDQLATTVLDGMFEGRDELILSEYPRMPKAAAATDRRPAAAILGHFASVTRPLEVDKP
jgi:hypothetical protein